MKHRVRQRGQVPRQIRSERTKVEEEEVLHEVRTVVPTAYEEIRTDLCCTVREPLVVLSELDKAPQKGI